MMRTSQLQPDMMVQVQRGVDGGKLGRVHDWEDDGRATVEVDGVLRLYRIGNLKPVAQGTPLARFVARLVREGATVADQTPMSATLVLPTVYAAQTAYFKAVRHYRLDAVQVSENLTLYAREGDDE